MQQPITAAVIMTVVDLPTCISLSSTDLQHRSITKGGLCPRPAVLRACPTLHAGVPPALLSSASFQSKRLLCMLVLSISTSHYRDSSSTWPPSSA
jgi:hypothetical protein